MRMIDGDALKEKFCNHCDERDCKPDATDTVYGCVIADTIDKTPTIEAEPVKYGRWVRKHNSFPQRYFCTECGGGDVGRFAFCHHCGARMSEV